MIEYRESDSRHHRIIDVRIDGYWRAAIHQRAGEWECPQLADGRPLADEVREAVRDKLRELEAAQ